MDVLDGAFLDPYQQDPYQLGPYQLLARLGEGGMGVVHLALDADGRAVAVKALHPHLLDDGGRERLARELDALQRVVGPHVAEVLDADLDADPPYLVMRYVQGRALPERIRRHGAMHGEELHALALGLARALAVVHGAGVVHRDVKPGNVLLADGRPVLVDFGLAHVLDETRLTATGLLLGTPGYVAPEAVLGGPVTPAADVHGWGATVAYAATGAPPYGPGPFEVVLGRVLAGQHDLRGVPDGLLPLVAAALDPDPFRRPRTHDVLAVLDAGHAPPGRPPTEAPPPVYAAPPTLVPPLAFTPPPALPPRLRPATGILLGLLVLLASLAALAPLAVAAVAAGLVVLLRAVDLSRAGLHTRREVYGPRRSDVPAALAVAPWQVLRALVALLLTLPQAVLAVVVALVAVFLLGVPGHVPRGVPLAAVALAALLAITVAPGTRGVRRGAATLAGVLAPGRTARLLVVAGCLAIAAMLLLLLPAVAPAPWPASSYPSAVRVVLDRLSPPS